MKRVFKKLGLLSLTLLMLSADKAAEKVLISEVNFFNGIYKHKDQPVTGEIIDYYENSILKFTYAALEGRLHGEAKEFFSDGHTKSVRHYKVNKLFGDFMEYTEDGDILVQFKVGLNAYGKGELLSEIKVSKGKKGKFKEYDEGVLIFMDGDKETDGTSEEISILSQTKFKILDPSGKLIFQN
ncbi:hypothetical protein [Roseivirga sp.]|uniref:hypothetical protein n=1 Tax=Roseivirga sp. TaxID=1964215 RepID=UPI003B5243A3